MKINFLYIAALLLSLQACGQTAKLPAAVAPARMEEKDFELENFIPGNFSQLSVDALGNVYVITDANQLRKYNEKGDSLSAYDNVKKYGKPGFVDVSNPLKILLYYPNFSTAVTLDRLLTFRNSLNLRSLQIFSVKALSISYDNQLWVFDEQDNKLKKISEDGTLLSASNDLRVVLPFTISPQSLVDKNNNVYLYDSSRGFTIFDYYGSLKNTIPLLHWQQVSVNDNFISGISAGSLLLYSLKDKIVRGYTLPAFLQQVQGLKAMNNRLYVLVKTGVEIYRIK
ncbi:MAG: hypothetical protein ABIT96_02030 [Ferruginibacter sp.]